LTKEGFLSAFETEGKQGKSNAGNYKEYYKNTKSEKEKEKEKEKTKRKGSEEAEDMAENQ
jgi:hypothetical protein